MSNDPSPARPSASGSVTGHAGNVNLPAHSGY